MGLLVDTTPLRVSADFRRLWIAQGLSFAGSTMTMAALPYQVFHMTGSSVDVGLLGLSQLVPLLVFAVVGGVLADRFEKRRLLLTQTVLSLACSTALAVNARLAHPQLWAVFVLGAAASAMAAMTMPLLRALLPLLLESQHRPAAFALQATYGSFGMMAGPAAAGLVIGVSGLPATYAIDAVTYVVAALLFLRIAAAPPVPGSHGPSARSLLGGFRFLRGTLVMSVFGVDLLAMVFGMPRALFPALAQRLGGGPALYGLLLSSVAAGAFVASVTSGWTGRVRRQGAALLVAVSVWGLTIAAAGVSRWSLLVLALFAAAGAADMISGVYRSTIAAEVTPDHLRGRISGVELAVYAGGPVLGDVEAGLVGGLAGVPFAIVSGGLACIAGAGLFAVCVPRLSRYVSDHRGPPAGAPPEPPPSERASESRP